MQLAIFYLISLLNFHQTQQADSRDIFSPSRVYYYQTTFISPSGDTLSREQIIIKPTGLPWKYDKTQTAFEIHYNGSPRDSIIFQSYLNPQSKKKKKPKNYVWVAQETTGAIEDEQQVWMHPIRSNQYNYTEVAPFPKVMLDSLKVGGRWENSLFIMMGWGAFKGKVENQYQAVQQETRKYGNLTLDNCWLICSVGKHSKLGNSYLDFYFHPKFGFVEMNYRFYDGAKITFVLKELVDRET